MNVGDALRTHVEEQMKEVVSKYFSDAVEANVTFSRDAHLFRTDIAVHASRGIVLQSTYSADMPYPAFDAALSRLGSRLRRHKTKLTQHNHESSREQASMIANSFVLSGDSHEEEVGDSPVIVAEMTTPVEMLTVSAAVMKLDLEDLPALLFRNSSHGGLNMIYRRADGNIGWVDPTENAKVQ